MTQQPPSRKLLLNEPLPAGELAEDSIDLRALITALWRRRWVVVAATVVGIVLAYAIVSQVEPRYAAKASVVLEQQNVRPLGSDGVVSDLTLNNPLMDTQVAVMRSNLLLEQVITSFPPERLAVIDPANDRPGLITRVRQFVGGLFGRGGSGGGSGASPLMTEEERRVRRLIGAINRSMTVWREGQSYLISVRVETEDAQLSMLLANSVVDNYIAGQVDQRSTTVRSVTDFLGQQVTAMEDKVEVAEAAVEDFRFDQLIGGGASIDSIAQQLSELSTQIALARAELVSAEARFNQFGDDGAALPAANDAETLLSSPLILTLREQKSNLEREDIDLSTRYGPDHPERQRVERSLTLIEADLASEIDRIKAGLENDVTVARLRLQSLQESASTMELQMAELSRASLALRQLEREAQAQRATYEAALERFNQSRSIEQLKRADARVVERAMIPGGPSAPRTTLFMALGGSLGFMGGLLLIYLQSVSRQGFTSSAEIERALGRPVLASLPTQTWRSGAEFVEALRNQTIGLYSERLRQILVGLRLRSEGGQLGTVLVTSATLGEGKTSVAVGLAHQEARANRSCLLLDLDVRRSGIRQMLEFTPPEGDLISYLRGKSPLDACIQRKTLLGFDLLTTKEHAPDLFEEIPLDQVAQLLAHVRKHYDTVIVDSAPVLMVSETVQLAQITDMTLYLVRNGVTRRRAVQESVQRLRPVTGGRWNVAMTMTDPAAEKEEYGFYGEYKY